MSRRAVAQGAPPGLCEPRHKRDRIVQVLFIAAALLITGHAILTPLLMALIMIVGDILGMSLTTDSVQPSPHPNSWRIGKLIAAGVVMALGELAFCFAVLGARRFCRGL